MFILKEISDKNIWNSFIIDSDIIFYSFVDSWEWWEFQKLEGNSVLRYWIFDQSEKKLIGLIQLIRVEARRGVYLFTPHGPLILPEAPYFEVLKSIKDELSTIAKTQKASFIRLNSTVENTKENKKSYKEVGFIDAPMHVHAEDTHLLDVTPTEEEIFQNIKKEDRYYINRARKEGVVVRIDNKSDHIQTLIDYHHSHAKRTNWKHTYNAFSERYIKNLYKIFPENDISTISTAYDGKIESILMTIKFWKFVIYYIAASDIVSKKFSPNYLCQWEAILKAKRDGAKLYNFWGVSPEVWPSKHPISWVSAFKRKFSGYDYSLLHAQDLVISPKYWGNWLIETIRRKKRGYYYKQPE